jgi:hypothetical protein
MNLIPSVESFMVCNVSGWEVLGKDDFNAHKIKLVIINLWCAWYSTFAFQCQQRKPGHLFEDINNALCKTAKE